MFHDPRLQRLEALLRAALAAPPGRARKALALLAGSICHLLFAAAIGSMAYAMFNGLTTGLGTVPDPLGAVVNLALIAQFPLAHSWLLGGDGGRLLARCVPGGSGPTLATTTYAAIASLQLLLLFWLWTPSGIVWWRAEGTSLALVSVLYGLAWLLLAKAVFDAGADLQSGALGWLSLYAGRRPRFPDLPTLGLFRVVRQPIYLAFACTLWTVPTWTPDQLALATGWTAYCVVAPRRKERRLQARHGERFEAYRRRVPYMLPRLGASTSATSATSATGKD